MPTLIRLAFPRCLNIVSMHSQTPQSRLSRIHTVTYNLSYLSPAYSLLHSMPAEILEKIAHSLWIHPTLDVDCFLMDHCTDFSTVRFDISALSQVSSYIRSAVECRMY